MERTSKKRIHTSLVFFISSRMKLRNQKTYKNDEPEVEWYSDINPITGACECLDCTRIAGCVFHETREQEERKKKAETKARAQVMYEAEVYALEKAGGDSPEGIPFLDFYLLHYRAYYQRTYDNRYREVYEKIGRIYWNRVMRKKPEDRGFICELCENGKIW
jgi:hypothetical protein